MMLVQLLLGLISLFSCQTVNYLLLAYYKIEVMRKVYQLALKAGNVAGANKKTNTSLLKCAFHLTSALTNALLIFNSFRKIFYFTNTPIHILQPSFFSSKYIYREFASLNLLLKSAGNFTTADFNNGMPCFFYKPGYFIFGITAAFFQNTENSASFLFT